MPALWIRGGLFLFFWWNSEAVLSGKGKPACKVIPADRGPFFRQTSVIRLVKSRVSRGFMRIPGRTHLAIEAGTTATPLPVSAHVRLVRASSLMHR